MRDRRAARGASGRGRSGRRMTELRGAGFGTAGSRSAGLGGAGLRSARRLLASIGLLALLCGPLPLGTSPADDRPERATAEPSMSSTPQSTPPGRSAGREPLAAEPAPAPGLGHGLAHGLGHDRGSADIPTRGDETRTAGPVAGSAATEAWSWPVAGLRTVLRPFHMTSPYAAGHRGIDVAAAPGATIHAPADGVVRFVGRVAGRPVLSVTHEDGSISSFEPVDAAVVEGARVARGERIGALALDVRHEPHGGLHLGLREDDSYRNPLERLGGIPPAVLLPDGPDEPTSRIAPPARPPHVTRSTTRVLLKPRRRGCTGTGATTARFCRGVVQARG